MTDRTIYTGRGDDGMTDLGDASRVSKTSSRIEAYGTVDEANAVLGRIRPTGYDDLDEQLRRIQNHLHIIQAEFATPGTPDADSEQPHIRTEHVDRLERWIDEADEHLEPLNSFVLPGGSENGAGLHHARTVVRRAERRAVALAEDERVNEQAITYLNRLSDVLFTFARLANQRDDVPEPTPTY